MYIERNIEWQIKDRLLPNNVVHVKMLSKRQILFLSDFS